jgi:hypothetical protein
MDALANFGYSTVAVAPVPALSGTSLTVVADTFPAAPFNVTVWPVDAPLPLSSNAEIIRVTAKAGLVFTILRAQEGTSAKPIAAGWNFANSITKALLESIIDLCAVQITETHAYFATPTAGRYLKIAGANVGSLPP